MVEERKRGGDAVEMELTRKEMIYGEGGVESDFPTSGMAGTCGTDMARARKRLTHTSDAHLTGGIVPAKMVPCGTLWHAGTTA